MKKVTLEFHDVRDELPEKSGDYITYRNGFYSCMPYSAKYKAFNQYDFLEYSEEHTIRVEYWAEEPDGEIFGEEGEQEDEDSKSEA